MSPNLDFERFRMDVIRKEITQDPTGAARAAAVVACVASLASVATEANKIVAAYRHGYGLSNQAVDYLKQAEEIIETAVREKLGVSLIDAIENTKEDAR